VSDLFPTTEDVVVDYGDMEKSIHASKGSGEWAGRCGR